MKLEEYAKYDGLGLAALVRRREVKPGELVDCAIQAIEALNPKLNAVVRRLDAMARKTAKGELPRGAFTGVPFLLKDLTHSLAGVPTDCGSRFFKGWTRGYDTEMVKRFKAAGFIITAKTNTPEAGSSGSTEPVATGPTHNPWKLGYSSGGSSGGSAAGVAAGITPVAHANDGGGSIRIPASACGLVGLKPSRGRTSYAPDWGEAWNGMAIEGVVSRTVRDTAASLDVMWQPAVGDPYTAPPPARPYLSEVGAPVETLRVGVSWAAPRGSAVHAECVKAAKKAAKLLSGLGHKVEEAAPKFDIERLEKAWSTIFQANEAWAFLDYAAATGKKISNATIEKNNLALVEAGQKLSAVDILRAVNDMHAVTREYARFFERYDILLTPTLGSPPPKHGYLFADENADRFFERLMAFIPFTPIQNATGNPAITLPLHWSADGLPVGAHFVARYGNEALLLRLAAQIEEAEPWCHKHPKTGLWKN
ncbi:MAG: amidase [Alphaproteobacteria bacterium]